MSTPTDASTDYINSTRYTDWQSHIKNLVYSANELQSKSIANRRLRYSEIDVEGERKAGRITPDELLIPQHVIDTNIRREQSSYVQYVTQSNRAAILSHVVDGKKTSEVLERDLTNRLRYEGWQIPMYKNIDAFEQEGYSFMEIVLDTSKAGDVAHEYIPLGDFGLINDTKDVQECEMTARRYYFPKTKLLAMCNPESGFDFKLEEINKVLGGNDKATDSDPSVVIDKKDKSLYLIWKVMFRVKGVVQVAWCSDDRGDDWIREPRPLFIGRREQYTPEELMSKAAEILKNPLVSQQEIQTQTQKLQRGKEVYETEYPYVPFSYLISENDTLSQQKGRVYLDQDTQEAVMSLLSSYCSSHRRAAQPYFSRDSDNDPNADILMQKNVYFRPGALINSKIKQFQLMPPGADTLSAIQTLVTANQNETSQVNFAAQNRKDSRKTATEISAATQASQALSTVQVVLFSASLRCMYQKMFDIIRSRVICGLIQVQPEVLALYQESYKNADGKMVCAWAVKPSGDVDVIERQQLIQQMMSAWPVIQNTPASMAFLSDLLLLMFPAYAQKYIQIFQQAQQAQQQQQQNRVSRDR